MTWRDVALKLYCPHCGAAPGELCHGYHGERQQVHWPRYATARLLAGVPLLSADRVPRRYRVKAPYDPPAAPPGRLAPARPVPPTGGGEG